jgi:catechol 2,3-dioxygenase-like lactoylglutathione lyase family enzyme
MASTYTSRPSPPSHILETCLYVRDMTQSTTFYNDVLGLEPQMKSPRLTMFPLGNTTLILFQLGMTESDSVSENGVVPGHGPDERTVSALTRKNSDRDSEIGKLHTHYCLAVSSPKEVETWEEYLKSKEVKLRGVMNWQKGGRSVYFEDPDGHIGEIGSRGIWEHW